MVGRAVAVGVAVLAAAAAPAGAARTSSFDAGWRFALGDGRRARAAGLRRLRVAAAGPAARLEHRAAAPRRREHGAGHRLLPGRDGLVPQGVHAPARARAASAWRSSSTASTWTPRSTSTAARSASHPYGYTGFEVAARPRHDGRQRARGQGAQPGPELALVLGQRHLPPRPPRGERPHARRPPRRVRDHAGGVTLARARVHVRDEGRRRKREGRLARARPARARRRQGARRRRPTSASAIRGCGRPRTRRCTRWRRG